MFGQGFNSGFFGGPNYIYKEDIFGDDSCIGLYTMDYDFSDSSGNNNDMGVFGSPDHGVSGGLNLGARFDGYNTSARAYPVSDLQGLTAVSISFWFKWDDSTSVSNYGHMVNIGDMGNTGNGDAFGIAVGDDGGTFNRVLYGYFPEGSLSTGQTVTDNVWHHVLMTYSGTTVKYYYDGSSTPIATQTRTSLSLQNSAVNRITVGHYAYNGNHHFKGDLDHLRVFNREIQSSELATLYNEKFYSPKATTTNINYPVTNTAYYKLDNSAIDEKGNYTGTETNMQYRFGPYGQAGVFSGSSLIEIPAKIPQSLNFTVSFWFNSTSTYASSYMFSTKHNSVTNGWWIILNNSVPGSINYGEGNGSTNATTITSNSTNLNDGNWHHAVVTRAAGGTVNMYIDGVREKQDASVGSGYMTSSTWHDNLHIGRYAGTHASGLYYTGEIDQVRIFESVLSPDQVTKLYNEKPETDTSNFKTVLYEGNGGTNYISNAGMDLETNGGLVWVKKRDTVMNAVIFDSVRTVGANKELTPQQTYAEGGGNSGTYGYINSFDANGFTVKAGSTNGNLTNLSGGDYVAWVWKGGGDAVSNTDGSITSQVSANADAGFSIATYTGVGYPNSSTAEVGHGLSQAPELVIIKGTGGTGQSGGAGSWVVGTGVLSSDNWTGSLYLNSTAAYYTANNYFWNGATTNSVVKLKNDWFVNGNNNNYVMYCFHSVSGYSKIGTYEGLGTSDVTISGIGFKPSFIMVKNADATSNWNIYDTARGTIEDRMNNLLYPNLSNAESGAASTMFITVNDDGFVVNDANHLQLNYNGDTFIYMAFK